MGRPTSAANAAPPGPARNDEPADPLGDADVAGALAEPRHEVPRARQIFVNRNLRMDKIELVGFDMDYTLAIYNSERIERLSFELTVKKLVAERGYAPEIGGIRYDPAFVQRGLVVDKATGNLIKPDRYEHVGRACHGRRRLTSAERAIYRNEKVRLASERYGSIDTLFALPEACLYAEMVEVAERTGRKLDYARLYEDIRECIDTVHRDGSLKAILRKNIAHYLAMDPELGAALHKLRSGGKKLFLLTNSLWDYTDAVMRCVLDKMLPEYPSWRNYFDVIVVGANKPAFFTAERPFAEVDAATGEPLGEALTLERGKAYQGGNLAEFERRVGIGGEVVLYVGDHIYGDILRSKKTSLWRTCMVVPELEDEIAYIGRQSDRVSTLRNLESVRARLDEAINVRKLNLNALERRIEREQDGESNRALDEERRKQKALLDKLRRALRTSNERAEALEEELERGFNPSWGLLFKEGTENSRFGQQTEQYACIYTSRVSNFAFYSPMQYFRSFRDTMPHERGVGPDAGLLRLRYDAAEGP